MHARLISSTQIDTTVPRTAYIDGRLVTGELPEPYLNSQRYYRVETSEAPTPQEGYHSEPRYAYDDAESPTKIEQTWVQVEDPPAPPRTFSKLKLLEQAEAKGVAEQVIVLLRDNALLYEKWSAASVLRENNDAFKNGVALVKRMLGLTDEQIEEALAASVAD